MNVDFWSPSDTTAASASPAGHGANTIEEHADLLIRAPGRALWWRGLADESAAAVGDLAVIAAELAARGQRATLTVRPADGELVAAVRIA